MTDYIIAEKKKEEEKKPDPNAPKSQEQIDSEKVANLIAKAKSVGGDTKAGELYKKIKPAIDRFNQAFNTVCPYVEKTVSTIMYWYAKLPMDVLYAIFGLILAFFGGCFALTIVAIEAFFNSGYETVRYNGEQLYYELKDIWKRSREDDQIDANKDGVPDILEGSTRDLITHKIGFFFANCKDPKKIMDMISGIASCFIAVLAVLKIDFAKVIALGNSIGEALKKPANLYLVPLLAGIVPEKFQQWISPIINYACKFIAISIAMIIQRVISAVQSGIRGGLLFSRKMLKFLKEKGYIEFNEEESYLDEIVGWVVAFVGVYFQLAHGFSLPFPMNILLFPLVFFENFLAWAISYMN